MKIYIVKFEHTSFYGREVSYRFEGILTKFYHTEEEAEQAIKAEIEKQSQRSKQCVIGERSIDFKDEVYRYAIDILEEA